MGSVQQVINLKELRTVKIPNPPLEEQRAIAAVLRRFDAAIDVNERMNQTTEEIATALFRSLLVDFDPVRALSEGRPTNLPRDVEDLFPRKLVAVDSVEVPDGWNVVGLDEMATFLNGLALQRFPPRGPDSLPAIKIAQLRTMRTNDADRVSAEIPPEYLVEDGDILFSWSGSLTCVLWAGARGALNQHLFKVIPKGTPRWLCYLAIQHHMAEFRRIAAAKATTMGHIQRHHLSEARIAVPPREVLTELSRIFDPLIESTWRRAVTSRTLESLRESLLPRLLSGELGVGIEAVS
jgi:type I restriction enzyme S subunit